MKRIQRPYKSVCTVSIRSLKRVRQYNSAHARQVTSHKSVHSDTDNISYPHDRGGDTLMGTFIHRKITEDGGDIKKTTESLQLKH